MPTRKSFRKTDHSNVPIDLRVREPIIILFLQKEEICTEEYLSNYV